MPASIVEAGSGTVPLVARKPPETNTAESITSPRTLLEELARIQAHDVILPTHAHGEIRLRCVSKPDAAQAALLDRLGLVLPKRIRLPEVAAETAALPAA